MTGNSRHTISALQRNKNMYRDKLLELVNIGDTQARKMNFAFYWETPNGKRLGNVYVARWYEKEFNCWLPFVTAPELIAEFRETPRSADGPPQRTATRTSVSSSELERVAALLSLGTSSKHLALLTSIVHLCAHIAPLPSFPFEPLKRWTSQDCGHFPLTSRTEITKVGLEKGDGNGVALVQYVYVLPKK